MRTIRQICLLILFFPVLIYGQTEAYHIEEASFSKKGLNEFSPVLYGEGIVFSANYNSGLANYTSSENEGFYNLYFADTLGKTQLFSKELTSKLNDGPASFNLTGDTIYFSRNLIVKGKAKELSSPKNNLGIFSAALINEKWTDIRRFEHNNSYYNLSYDVTGPALSPEGSRLYFSSNMPGGFGGFDIYYSDYQNGKWGDPVNLGEAINTNKDEGYPFVNGFGELLFSSDGHPGYGKKDIYISRFNDSEWEKPVALLPPVNSEYDDFGISTDDIMSRGYFSTSRESSVDIFQFRTLVPQVLFPEPQKQSSLCYSFSDSSSIPIDTTKFYYNWNFGDGKKGRGVKTNHCYEEPGKYKVSLELIDKSTGRKYLSRKESLIQITNLRQAYINSSDIGIAGYKLDFDALKTNLPGYRILSYTWDFGDGSFSSGAKTEHVYNSTGFYNVLLGIIISSENSGKVERRSISKRIQIVPDEQTKNKLEKQNLQIIEKYPDFTMAKNIESLSSTQVQDVFQPDFVFSLVIFTSKEKIPNNDQKLKRLSTRFDVKSVWDTLLNEYLYYTDRQYDALSLHRSFLEIQKMGFSEAHIQQMVLNSATDIELMRLIKTYGNSLDSYFDKSGRLTSTAYIMLNQLIKLMNNNPGIKLNLTVHTDNLSSASQSQNLSKDYANTITDYLIARGIPSAFITAKGAGSSSPIASNSTEAGRLQNRRIDFLLSE